MSAAEELLRGPRGRALCWAVLLDAADEMTLFGAIADLVVSAVYWQEPVDAAIDRVLADDAVAAAEADGLS